MNKQSKHARIIVFCNEKGGVGKSTSAHHLACSLGERGYLVLAVDFDPQGALSCFLGADNTDALNILDVLSDPSKVTHAVQRLPHVGGVDVISANSALSTVDEVVRLERDTLSRALEPLRAIYDFIIIDTEPEPKNRPIITALDAADQIIIPVQAEPQPVKCLSKMVATALKVKGQSSVGSICVLITKHHRRINVYKQYEKLIRDFCLTMGIKCFDSNIRQSCVVPESQSHQNSLLHRSLSAPVTADYESFAEGVLSFNSMPLDV